jgi:hypothetical protein
MSGYGLEELSEEMVEGKYEEENFSFFVEKMSVEILKNCDPADYFLNQSPDVNPFSFQEDIFAQRFFTINSIEIQNTETESQSYV